ncbi:MAG: hypothetical protein ISS93_02870 [Candidatus Aenigmarchaeota archaeon]|nr:hypothetical protein [Candidatus Aenigmarchaeota archaeon]
MSVTTESGTGNKLRIARHTYKGIVEDMFRSNLSRGPPKDILDAYGSEFVYVARGPPEGPIDDYLNVTKVSSIIHSELDVDAVKEYVGNTNGQVAIVHNHVVGSLSTCDTEVANIHRLSALVQRPIMGLIYGQTGYFYGAAYAFAGISESTISDNEKDTRGMDLLDILVQIAGVEKDESWHSLLDWSVSYEEALERGFITLADIHCRSNKLARGFVLIEDREPKWHYIDISIED